SQAVRPSSTGNDKNVPLNSSSNPERNALRVDGDRLKTRSYSQAVRPSSTGNDKNVPLNSSSNPERNALRVDVDRPKARSCSQAVRPSFTGNDISLNTYSNSRRDTLISEPVKKLLLEIDVITALNIDQEKKEWKYNYFILKIRPHDFTQEDKIVFIKKISLWIPVFPCWSCKLKSMLHRQLRLLGIFSKITTEIQLLQVKLMESLISAINIDCQTNPESINPISLSSLLTDIKFVIDHDDSLLKELSPKVDNIIVEILAIIASCKKRFTWNTIGGSISAIVKLLQKNRLSKNDNCVRGAICFLLKRIAEEKSKFALFQLEYICLDIKSLIQIGMATDTNNSGVNVAILLLPYISKQLANISAQQIHRLLTSISYLAEKSPSKKHSHFNEVINILLCAIPKRSEYFNFDNIMNVFYSLATFLDIGLIKGNELFFTEAAASLTPRLIKEIKKYSGGHICTLIRCIGKFIYINPNLISKFESVFRQLLDIAPKRTCNESVYSLSIMLWGIGSVANKIVFNAKSIDNISKIYNLTIDRLKKNVEHLPFSDVSSILWGFGQLMEYKLVHEDSHKSSLPLFVINQLNFFLDTEESFGKEVTIIILDRISKLLLYVSDLNFKLVDRFFVKFITLLSAWQNKITATNACKIIGSIGKLTCTGGKWTKDVNTFNEALLDSIIRQGTKNTQKVPVKRILHTLDYLTITGLQLKNMKDFLRHIIRSNIIRDLKMTKNKSWMLSSITYFYSWYDEGEPLKKDLRKEMLFLVNKIDKKFSEDESDKSDKSDKQEEYPSISMSSAKFWLGTGDDNMNINYTPTISNKQKHVLFELRKRYADCKIESEVSLGGQSPVDIVLPEFMLAVEVNGPQHYLDYLDDCKILNGKSISKYNACMVMGYTVIHISIAKINVKESKNLLSLYQKIDDHIAEYKSN
ncbi:MAG: hypothetical protein KAG53_12040, partial [Endozoicomonadaceae bacterium]|nr:hypothetical protein [Endozoicomonadaceae bacterium]